MKIRFIWVLTVMLIILCACGQEVSSVSAEPSAVETETFGTVAEEQTPQPMAEVTAAAEPSEQPREETAEETAEMSAETPAEAKNLTELAIRSVVLCDYREMMPYEHGEPVLFWRAMAYLVDAVGWESDKLTVTEEGVECGVPHLEEFVQALFGGYDEDYPAVTEENPFVYSKQGEEYEILVFSVVPYDGLDVAVSPVEPQEDGTFTAKAEVFEQGELVGTYTAVLRRTAFGGEENLFPYSVVDLRTE